MNNDSDCIKIWKFYAKYLRVITRNYCYNNWTFLDNFKRKSYETKLLEAYSEFFHRWDSLPINHIFNTSEPFFFSPFLIIFNNWFLQIWEGWSYEIYDNEFGEFHYVPTRSAIKWSNSRRAKQTQTATGLPKLKNGTRNKIIGNTINRVS